MPTSFCTTSSLNLRPIRRFTANRVFLGLVTAWRLADWPTTTSLSLVKATMDGVVRSPSLFSITRGLPASMTATQELVVPRSIPMTLAICDYLQEDVKRLMDVSYVGPSAGRFKCMSASLRLAGDNHARRPQQATVEFVTRLDHLQYRARLGGGRWLHGHGLVLRGIKRRAQRVDGQQSELLECPGQQLQ